MILDGVRLVRTAAFPCAEAISAGDQVTLDAEGRWRRRGDGDPYHGVAPRNVRAGDPTHALIIARVPARDGEEGG